MKKVYIVTAGQYSDYGICEVFSKKELAEEYIERNERVGYFNYNEVRIEEYPVDNNLPDYPKGLFHYEVSIDLSSGKIEFIEITKINDDKKIKYEVFTYLTEEVLNVYCWAKNKDTAKKIAYDIRTKVLAEKANL